MEWHFRPVSTFQSYPIAHIVANSVEKRMSGCNNQGYQGQSLGCNVMVKAPPPPPPPYDAITL